MTFRSRVRVDKGWAEQGPEEKGLKPQTHLVHARLGGDWKKSLANFEVLVQKDWFSESVPLRRLPPSAPTATPPPVPDNTEHEPPRVEITSPTQHILDTGGHEGRLDAILIEPKALEEGELIFDHQDHSVKVEEGIVRYVKRNNQYNKDLSEAVPRQGSQIDQTTVMLQEDAPGSGKHLMTVAFLFSLHVACFLGLLVCCWRNREFLGKRSKLMESLPIGKSTWTDNTAISGRVARLRKHGL